MACDEGACEPLNPFIREFYKVEGLTESHSCLVPLHN
jgi:hypothetical protein